MIKDICRLVNRQGFKRYGTEFKTYAVFYW